MEPSHVLGQRWMGQRTGPVAAGEARRGVKHNSHVEVGEKRSIGTRLP